MYHDQLGTARIASGGSRVVLILLPWATTVSSKHSRGSSPFKQESAHQSSDATIHKLLFHSTGHWPSQSHNRTGFVFHSSVFCHCASVIVACAAVPERARQEPVCSLLLLAASSAAVLFLNLCLTVTFPMRPFLTTLSKNSTLYPSLDSKTHIFFLYLLLTYKEFNLFVVFIICLLP